MRRQSVEGLTVNAHFVLESLINDMIDRAEQAREEGNREAFFAYFAMIERGLAEAEEHGIKFDSSELRTLDPYRLFGGFGPRRTEAGPSQSAPQSPSMVGLEALTSPPVRYPPPSEPRQSRASGQVSIEVTIESDDAGELHAADAPPPPRLTVGQIVRGLPSMFPFAFPSGVLMLVLVIASMIHVGEIAPGAFILWAVGTPFLAGVFRVLSWFVPPMPKR